MMEKDIPNRVRQVVEQFDMNAQVVLFGSRARGDFREESDWDFLILLEKTLTAELKDDLRAALYDLELETNTIISSLIHNRKDWANRAVMPIYQIIEVEGIAV